MMDRLRHFSDLICVYETMLMDVLHLCDCWMCVVGRRSSQYQQGVVTTWQQAHLMYVKAVMKFDIPQIAAAGIFPSIDQVEHVSILLQHLDVLIFICVSACLLQCVVF